MWFIYQEIADCRPVTFEICKSASLYSSSSFLKASCTSFLDSSMSKLDFYIFCVFDPVSSFLANVISFLFILIMFSFCFEFYFRNGTASCLVDIDCSLSIGAAISSSSIFPGCWIDITFTDWFLRLLSSCMSW